MPSKLVLTVGDEQNISREVFNPKNEVLFIGTARQGESHVMVFGNPAHIAKHELLEHLTYDTEQIFFECETCKKKISWMEYETHEGLCDGCTGV